MAGRRCFRGLLVILCLGCCRCSFAEVQAKQTIAILRFENKSIFDRLDAFEIALPCMLISDLSKISSVQLVERDKINKLMAETGLAEKDLMDSATAQRAGKALGADFIITGSFREEIKSGAIVGEADGSKLSIEVCVKDVMSGKIVKEIKVNGKTKEFFKIEKEVIQELIRILNMSLTRETRKEVDCISTQSLEAVLHFGRGEKFAIMSGRHCGWRGMVCGEISEEESEKLLLRAISEFRQALYLDPEYADAQYAIAITFGDLAGVASSGGEKREQYSPSEMAESEKFISQFPDDARCVERVTRLGHLYSRCGYMNYMDYEKQTEYYDKAIQWYKKRVFEYGHIKKGIVEAIRQLAYAFEGKKDYINAIETFEYLIKHYPEEKGHNLYPAKMQARYRIFDYYKRMKKYSKALETLNYIMTNQLFPKPYLDKSYPKKMLGEHRDDILVLRKLRGDIYFEMGDYEKAVNEWLGISERITELANNGIRAILGFRGFAVFDFWFDLAEAHRKLNEKSKVISFLEKAVNYPSRCNYNKLRDVYFELGQFYEQQGNYAKALSMYEASLERVGPDLHLEERIPICKRKLKATGNAKLVEWLSFSPLRNRDKRFATEPSIKGRGFAATCIATWEHSVWVPFAAYSYYKRDLKGGFKFKLTGNEYPCWYLYCLNLDSMTEKIIEIPDAFEIGWDEISDIAVDDKEVWLSCVEKGILCYDRLLKKWTHFTTDNDLVFNTSHCLALSQRTVWCGLGEKGRGSVMAYDRRQKKWLFYHQPVATTTAVTSLALDGDNLWVGNDKGTISILSTRDFSWRILQDKKGYTSTVEDIFVCKDTVWVACNVNGIRRYNRETKEWKIWDWDEPDLDCSLALKCITVDGGDIWVGGNGGVYKLDTLSDRFTKVDAGRFLKLSGASSIAVSDRFIWFINPCTLYNTIVHIKGGIVEGALKVDVE